MAKQCATRDSTNQTVGRLQLSWAEVFKREGIYNTLLSNKLSMLDNEAKRIDDARSAILDYIKKSDSGQLFMDKVKDVVKRNLGFEMNNKPTIPLHMWVTKVPPEVSQALKDLEDIYMKYDYKINKVINSTPNRQTFFSDMTGSMKQEVMSTMPSSAKDLKSEIINTGMWDYWMSTTNAKRFAEDMIGDPLGSGIRYKMVSNLKQIYRFLKYAPPFGILWGTLLLANNALVGWLRYFSEKVGVKKIFNSEAIDLLLDKWILGSVNKAADINLQAFYWEWQTYFNKAINFIVNKVPLLSPDKRAKLEAVMKWGIHSIWDMWMEDSIKRLSLSKALSKNGINENNIAKFVEDVKNNLVSKEFFDNVRTDAYLFNRDWYTNSGLTVLSRHRFSKRWIFNTMQSYALVRSDELLSSLKRFSQDLGNGRIKSMWDFLNYANTDNLELKSFMMSTLHAIKMGYYVDLLTWGKEDNHDNYKEYVLGMNDYFTAIQTTFLYRILNAPLEWLENYAEYQDMKWEKIKIIDWISTAALSTLTTTFQTMFREWIVLKWGLDWLLSYAKTGDLDFTKEILATDWEKITSWVGRFMLLPGMETYGTVNIKQNDDFFNFLTMSYQDTNKSVREASKIRGIADIEQMINDKKWYFERLLWYIPVLGWALNAQYGGKSETLYRMLNKMKETDPEFKWIYNGDFPKSLLNDPKLTTELKYELENFDYTNLTYEWMGKHVQNYASNQLKEDVFVPNIAAKVFGNVENMHAALIQNGVGKQLWMVKLLAAAEADVPGSSRIILSYLAKKDESAIKTRITWNKYASKAEISTEQQAAIDKEVVEKWYPYVYASDKTSRYRLAKEYVGKANPAVYSSVANDYDMKTTVNALSFMDMMIQDAGNKWDVDAKYIKNVFAVATKYVKDPKARITLVNNTLSTIGKLDAPSSIKSAMRVGVLAGNIDFYNSIKKDPTTAALYKDDTDNFENKVRWTLDNLNQVGNDSLLHGVSSDFKSNYYANKGKYYTPSKYSATNAWTSKQLQEKANTYYQPTRTTSPSSSRSTGTTATYPYNAIEVLEPKRYKTYAKTFNEAVQAKTDNIVWVKWKQYPAEFIAGLKFKTTGYTKANISAAKSKVFKAPKRKYVSGVANRNLPGG